MKNVIVETLLKSRLQNSLSDRDRVQKKSLKPGNDDL